MSDYWIEKGRIDGGQAMSDVEERLRGENWWLNVSGDEAADEIGTLRTHLMHRSNVNAELRAEIERLRAARHPMHPDLYAENVKLRDEVERLTAALREIHHATSFTMLATNYGRRGDIAFEIADAALERKP